MPERVELGELSSVSAEAIGLPGQRRFRLCAVATGGESASLWLEKEQLTALGDAIESVLDGEGYEYERLPLDDVLDQKPFPLSPSFDFRILQLSLGMNREDTRIVLVAADTAQPEADTVAVTFEFGFRLAFDLRRQIVEVVAAGRPPCPLCGAPLDATHICPRRNGHHAQE